MDSIIKAIGAIIAPISAALFICAIVYWIPMRIATGVWSL